MASTSTFKQLVRFQDGEGRIHYGEVESVDNLVGQTATIYDGEQPWSLVATTKKATIASVLAPLASVPLIYGVGLNYKKHIAEASFPTPEFPVIFTKPNDALAGPYEDVPVDPEVVELDYEGELSVVIGKDVKNFKKGDDPLPYILGYTVGNDVSSRYWQANPRSGGQHGMGKSFDKFAPLGPAIVSPSAPAIAGKLKDGIPVLELQTRVNGEVRQQTSTGDLLFLVSDILQFLSRGRTVRRGTVIMTGTPSGVAAFLDPPNWLKNGDVVEVEIEALGTIKNKMVIG
ncbi:hypothetical protein A1O3_04172 [Capronia epimyces CBS 606.96]|uniref:Fumarylacetoacetase-like C-terminal domain-containing protein n=1 Tax=Capronia epimyces CBS 606.96 TaxID=1182542 RepID=W9Y3W9_9EURO|nr:uncharacterized protein A1O3_04172 [Capronia epimyces CBS 606.96]EXJ87213.1 hypothetical protein A1O3_04172 [Capronia epimyces CBS 606.96]